jgi:hypothetical protein
LSFSVESRRDNKRQGARGNPDAIRGPPLKSPEWKSFQVGSTARAVDTTMFVPTCLRDLAVLVDMWHPNVYEFPSDTDWRGESASCTPSGGLDIVNGGSKRMAGITPSASYVPWMPKVSTKAEAPGS